LAEQVDFDHVFRTRADAVAFEHEDESVAGEHDAGQMNVGGQWSGPPASPAKHLARAGFVEIDASVAATELLDLEGHRHGVGLYVEPPLPKSCDGVVCEPAAVVGEVLAHDDDGAGAERIKKLLRMRHAGRGQDPRTVSGIDVETVVGDTAGAVSLPQVTIMKHLAAIDLALVEERHGADGDAGSHCCLLSR
jgi:hypothetical protein